MKKRFFLFFIITYILLSFLINLKSYAFDYEASNIFDSGTYSGSSQASSIDIGIDEARDSSKKLIATFILVLRVIGLGIAIIMLMVLGAKFIWGSIEQKVEAKKHLLVYAVGIAILFSGSVILGYIQEFIIGNFK